MASNIVILSLCFFFTSVYSLAPLHGMYDPGVIPKEYIVVLKPETPNRLERMYKIRDRLAGFPGSELRHNFTSPGLTGFSMRIESDLIVHLLRSNPDVEFIQTVKNITHHRFLEDNNNEPLPHETCHVTKPKMADKMKRKSANTTESTSCIFQSTLTQYDRKSLWGLKRINNRKSSSKSKDRYRYESNAGDGVFAYVLDTGVLTDHPEFEGRAYFGIRTGSDDSDTDIHGHGTHVAGIIGSKTYGVAKKVTIVAVKASDRYAHYRTDDVIKGLEWIQSDHNCRSRLQGYTAKSVVNLSVGFSGKDDALNRQVGNLIKDDISVVVSAGNEGTTACSISPALLSTAITVAAVTEEDAIPWWSNYGPCVDVLAPGNNIWSTTVDPWLQPSTASSSGTSTAAPFVTGVIARYLSTLPDKNVPSPDDILKWLQKHGTSGAIDHGKRKLTPDALLYMGCSS